MFSRGNMLVTLIVSHHRCPRWIHWGSISQFQSVVVEVDSIISCWISWAVVNDHTLQSKVRRIDQNIIKRSWVSACFASSNSCWCNFPSVRGSIGLGHTTVDFFTWFDLDSFSTVSTSIAIYQVWSQVPLFPKKRVVDTSTLTEL